MLGAPGGQEHLLDHLFGVAQIAEDAISQADGLAVVGVVQRFELGEPRTLRLRSCHSWTLKTIGPVGAGSRAGSSVMATTAPDARPSSDMVPSPVGVTPTDTGAPPGGITHAS